MTSLVVEIYDTEIAKLVTEDKDRIDVAFREVLSGMRRDAVGDYPSNPYPQLIVLRGPGLQYKGEQVEKLVISGSEITAAYIQTGA
jgi:hypothetical protein